MTKNQVRRVSIITAMVFILAVFMPAGMCLASPTDVFYKAQDTSHDKIYRADRGKKIDTMNMQIGWSFDKEDVIELTLSEGVYWYMNENDFEDLEIPKVELLEISSDHKTMKIEIVKDDCDEIDFADMKVAVMPDAPLGDITVSIGGDFSASLVVGEVLPCAEISTSVLPVDSSSMAAGDMTLKETYKNSLHPVDNPLGTADGEWYIGLTLPEGVSFAAAPKVSVNGIDITCSYYQECFRDKPSKIFSGAKRFEAGSRECYIKLDETQYFGEGKIDTVKITGLQYQVSKAFTGWEIAVGISGDMVNKLVGAGDELVPSLESNNKTRPAYSVVNATTEKRTALHGEMTMGSRKMLINGQAMIMDVSPYIRDNRTYLPVRYAAYALGIEDEGITWDSKTQTVTLQRGPNQVKMQVGSDVLYINGTEVSMDAAPEIKDDRVCLPIRYVAEAFSGTVMWDPLELTVTIDS